MSSENFPDNNITSNDNAAGYPSGTIYDRYSKDNQTHVVQDEIVYETQINSESTEPPQHIDTDNDSSSDGESSNIDSDSTGSESIGSENTGKQVIASVKIQNNDSVKYDADVNNSTGNEENTSNVDNEAGLKDKNESQPFRRHRRSGVVNEYENINNSPTLCKDELNEEKKNRFFPEDETKNANETPKSKDIIQCNSDSPSVLVRKSILRNGNKSVTPSLNPSSNDEDRKVSISSSIGIQINFDETETDKPEEDGSRKASVSSSLAGKYADSYEGLQETGYGTGTESDSDMGHINEGYLSDSYLDNITKQLDHIIEKSKEQQLHENGDCVPKKDGRRRKSSEVRFSERPDIKIEYDAYEDKPYYIGNNNGSTESFDTHGKSVADHVRKDSIALTKQNMSQLERIRKEFSIVGQQKPIWKRKSKALKHYRLHIGVTVLFILTLICVGIGWHFHKKSNYEKNVSQRIFFEARRRTIRLGDMDGQDHITGILGKELPPWHSPSFCSDGPEVPEQTCLKWKGDALLHIRHFITSNVNCYNISWKSLRPNFYPHDCIHIGSAMWYGLSNLTKPVWPLNGVNFTFSASSSNIFDLNTFTSAIEYYWLSSNGGVILVDNSVPLIVNWNVSDNSICLIANYTGEFYGYSERPNIYLNYTICNGIDTLKTHRIIRGLGKHYPKSLPERAIFQSPMWSTLAEAKTLDISDDDLESLLRRIKQSELNCSSIELDGKWEAHQGDLEFDITKFPNITKLAKLAKDEGCGLSLLVNPYISYTSASFSECLEKGYFLKGADGKVPGFINLQNTICAMLDVSNPTARSWFTGKLMNLARKYGIDSFHLHYGETNWIPYHPKYNANNVDANKILKMFSEMMLSISDEVILDGTAQSQHLPAFQRVSTKIEKTDGGLCLTGTIPSALTLGLLGYPFVLADGSFVMKKINDIVPTPTRNLYIRWLQLTAFFPAVKYAVTPWSYDDESLEVAKRSSNLHLKHVIPAIDSLKNKIPNGEPILRPLWWIDPSDKTLYTIEDQFLVGDDLMVAPILCEGMTSRMIYFPNGLWQDQNDQQFFQGSKWKSYNVSLMDIPYFKFKSVL